MHALRMERRFTIGPVAIAFVTLSFVVGAVGAARAETDSFDALVHSLKSQHDVVCTSPAMMWLGRLIVRAVKPEGVLDVRLATFEGDGLSRVAADASFGRLLQRVSDGGWSPLVRVRSRRDGSVSAVHVRRHHDRLSLLVVAINREDAVVVEVSVLPETLTRWLDEPRLIARRTH